MQPHFNSLHDFFKMGTHTFEIWSSFGIALAAVVVLFIAIQIQNKKIEKSIKKTLELYKN